jgi:hypothetical protein
MPLNTKEKRIRADILARLVFRPNCHSYHRVGNEQSSVREREVAVVELHFEFALRTLALADLWDHLADLCQLLSYSAVAERGEGSPG